MRNRAAPKTERGRRTSGPKGRPTVGIRELKARVSAIIEDVKDRKISYAVTKRGEVEALIVPVDAGEQLLSRPPADGAWEAWQTLADQLARGKQRRDTRSALEELDRMRR